MSEEALPPAPETVRAIGARHGELTFFVNDVGAVGRSLGRYGEWAENEIAFMGRFIGDGSVVLDVGAYVGTHTLAFARLVGPEGLVVAFEAQPDTFEVLRRNVSANRLGNVRLEHAAVGDGSGTADIATIDPAAPESFGSMSLRGDLLEDAGSRKAPAAAGPGRAQVRLCSIDSLGLDRCELIKIDAEGMESAIVRGAAETIRRLSPVIYAECNSVADGLLTLAELKSLGCHVRLHVVDAFAADNFFGETEDIFSGAREAALVGAPPDRLAELDSIATRPCELLLKIADADDLALGLLNKPQYMHEVLAPSAAAASGGARWIEEQTVAPAARETAEAGAACARTAVAEEQALRERTAQAFAAELALLKGAVADERARTDGLMRDLAQRLSAIDGRVSETRRGLERHDADMANQLALFEAAMRQARFAREAADAATERAATSEQAKAHARGMQAAAERAAEILEERLAETSTALAELRGSASWRMTRPLRSMVDRLRGRG